MRELGYCIYKNDILCSIYKIKRKSKKIYYQFISSKTILQKIYQTGSATESIAPTKAIKVTIKANTRIP